MGGSLAVDVQCGDGCSHMPATGHNHAQVMPWHFSSTRQSDARLSHMSLGGHTGFTELSLNRSSGPVMTAYGALALPEDAWHYYRNFRRRRRSPAHGAYGPSTVASSWLLGTQPLPRCMRHNQE